MLVNTVESVRYSLDVIREEVRHLVQQGKVCRNQRIYTICQYIPAREWDYLERELEQGNFLLRDRISDLLGREEWQND